MRQYHILGFATLILLSTGCAQGPMGLSWGADTSSSTQAAMLVNADETNAMAIIQNNCTSCHGSASGPAGVWGLTDLNHLVESNLIVPGQPDQSALFNAVSSASMPPTGALSAADQATLSHWISGQ